MQDGIAAAMVKVQVGIEHQINIFGLDPQPGQGVQQVTLGAFQAGVAPHFVGQLAAIASINQD